MKASFLAITLLFLLVSFPVRGQETTKLLLIGGGNHPPQLISRFVGEAGGAQAKILVVTWATDYPDQAMSQMAAEFGATSGVKVLEAPRRPFNENARSLFLQELSGASGLFFTGGDQTKIMSVISDSVIREALIKFYTRGSIVGGTSAGTAIMSPAMFTGHENNLAPGLGLLPGTLLDTHFLVRSRLPRLRAALNRLPRLVGLGIDQDNALWIVDGKHVEVFGLTSLTLVRTNPDGTQEIKSFKAGQKIDLP